MRLNYSKCFIRISRIVVIIRTHSSVLDGGLLVNETIQVSPLDFFAGIISPPLRLALVGAELSLLILVCDGYIWEYTASRNEMFGLVGEDAA
jgi:hypothetical protein